jgi:hypothetical protein
MTWRYGLHCHLSRGELALRRGDEGAARRLADESLALSVPSRSVKYESWAWRLKGECARRQRAWGEAEAHLTRAVRLAHGVVPSQSWRGHAALAALHAAQGRREAAAGSDATARALVEELRVGTQEAGLRAGLASAGFLGPLAESR